MCALATQTIKRKESFVRRAAPGGSARSQCVVADEAEFLRLLVQERKRSERSGRPFLLMMLDGGGMFSAERAGKVRTQVTNAVLESVRETDTVGWYKSETVLGAIFTELTDPVPDAVEAIKTKMKHAVRDNVPAEKVQRISISVHLFPDVAGEEPDRSADLTLYPDLRGRAESKKLAHGVKRFLDVSLSLAALILLLPILGTIAAVIKLTSKGPILFRQTRIGQYSRGFTFLKFRSMYVNCDPEIHKAYVAKFIAGNAASNGEGGGAKVFKITADPRVTPIGRFLRKTSLDELPQLFNVLRGDMSLVGPRPPLPYEVDKYDCWHRRRILEAKPGITGLWQVSGRSRTTFDEMVRLDLQYIQQHSLMLDLRILLQTPAAVFSGNGAY